MLALSAMERLIYISESQFRQSEALTRVADIVTGSLVNNVQFNLTGALFFTGTHFAQILEGLKDPLDNLMKSINKDARHTNIILVEQVPISERRFPDWSMAYYGPSNFISQHVLEVLHGQAGSDQRRAMDRLMDLAHELSVWRRSDDDAAPNL